MIPEIGHFSLILAMLVALVLGVLSIAGGQRGPYGCLLLFLLCA